MAIDEDFEQEEPSFIQSAPAPVLRAGFVGREEILATIKHHLLQRQHVCLYGDQGIGKTAILEEVVRWLREKKPELRFLHVIYDTPFKNFLFVLAHGLHKLGLFKHPFIGDDEMATLKWRQIAKRTRTLAAHKLSMAVG